MKIGFALLYFDERSVDADFDAYLSRVRAAHDLPEALAARGHEVSVVHLYPHEGHVRRDGVDHHFVSPGRWGRAMGRWLSRWRGCNRSLVTPARRPISRLLESQPEVIHFLGTTLHLNLASLLWRRSRGGPPVVLHHNGGDPAMSLPGRVLQRYSFARVSRVVFTTQDQADAHAAAGALRDGNDRVLRLVETSSRFRPADRRASRRRTGMHGDPVFLWAARLDPLKDPMTVLRGFEQVAEQLPEARLYFYHRDHTMLGELQDYVRRTLVLNDRVHFRGKVAYADMEAVFNSADFLLQGSLREHSGCAVLDAMACGTIPVVTDIPSFRAMRGDSDGVLLFPTGDAVAMAERVLEVAPDHLAERSRAARARFEEGLSFAVLAERLELAYGEVTT